MKQLVFFLFMSGSAAYAEPNGLTYVPSCIQQDWLSIEDDGPQKAIVIYSNSIEECSAEVDQTFTAPNGISVHIRITISEDETIYLDPEDPNFMSFPPEAKVKDGDKAIFHIMGGMS